MLFNALSAQLIEHEGLRLRAYQDHLGFWTIGVGHLIDPRKGGDTRFRRSKLTTITHATAMHLLQEDLEKFTTQLDEKLPWWSTLSDPRQHVLVDMAFNLGTAGLLSFRNTLRAVKDGHYEAAAGGMRNSLWARQVGWRAERLARMMERGEAVDYEERLTWRRPQP